MAANGTWVGVGDGEGVRVGGRGEGVMVGGTDVGVAVGGTGVDVAVGGTGVDAAVGATGGGVVADGSGSGKAGAGEDRRGVGTCTVGVIVGVHVVADASRCALPHAASNVVANNRAMACLSVVPSNAFAIGVGRPFRLRWESGYLQG